MSFKLSKRSLDRLNGVHPDLIKLLSEAVKDSPYDFGVAWYGGLRTIEMQEQLYAKGRTTEQLRAKGIEDVEGIPHKKKVTWTLKSNHMPKEDGYGHAVDIIVYKMGKVNWEDNTFYEVAQHIKKKASEMNISIQWGFDLWGKDLPHFQLG